MTKFRHFCLIFSCLSLLELGIGASFKTILQQVTEEKLEQLRIQKDLMTAHFRDVLKQSNGTSSEHARETLESLYHAVKTSPVKETIDANLIENLKDVLEFSNDDPSLTSDVLTVWITKIRLEIQRALRKCQYSFYFASMIGEWLEVDERRKEKEELDRSNAELEDTTKAKKEAIAKISKLIFTAPTSNEFNPTEFKTYLDKEFFAAGESTDVDNLVKTIRKESSEFLKVESHSISSYDVQLCITGLLSEDLFPEAKKSSLRELSQNGETVTEVASLLTSRMINLDRWNWPNATTFHPADVRRGLAGEYRAYLNEDILSALFLQYIGVSWAAFFKARFLRIYSSKMWTRVPYNQSSIESERNRYHKSMFLTSLPDSLQSQENPITDEFVEIESEETSDFVEIVRSKPRAKTKLASSVEETSEVSQFRPKWFKTNAPRPPPPPRPKPDIDPKQSFLHVLSTEIRLHQVLYPEKPLILVQTQLETFGHSLTHEAILIAMEKFGVSTQWLDFFKKFLHHTLKFTNSEAGQEVLRGVATSHALSKLFGETLLFVLESIVNRKCEGLKIYRISDEFWFWSKEESHVIKAWETLNEFGSMVGLKVNVKRSGSVKIWSEVPEIPKKHSKKSKKPKQHASVPGPSPLPQRNIHWGYLVLDSTGTLRIDQNSTEKFLAEMKSLLAKAECTLEWIQIFNKYMTFFVRNFGKAALIFGRAHLDQIVSSLRSIYTGVFGSLETSPIRALTSKFAALKEADLLDAWIYWPLEMGGLGLKDPFIDVLALRRTYEQINDTDLFTKMPLMDKLKWDDLIKSFKDDHDEPIQSIGGHTIQVQKVQKSFGSTGIQFVTMQPPTWEEYIAGRETNLPHWRDRYTTLLDRPSPQSPVMPAKYWDVDGIVANEDKNYFMWLYNTFVPQLELYFGTSTFINSGLLPKSIITHIQKANLQLKLL